MKRRQAITRFGAAAMALEPGRILALSDKFRGSGTLSLGVIADLHAGFVKNASVRLDEFLVEIKDKELDGLLQLGDFAFSRPEQQPLIDRFNGAHDVTLHVIGNHDIRDHGLKRSDCLKAWGMPSRYYRHDFPSMILLVLDGNDPGSPSYKGGYPSYVGKEQLDWLESQLKETTKPVIIASHQPLAGHFAVDNAKAIQQLLSRHQDRIALCINGHTHLDHHLNVGGVDYLHINSASYYWLGGKVRLATYGKALFAQLTVDLDKGEVRLQGRDSVWAKGTPEDANYFEGKNEHLRDGVRPQIRSRKLSLD
jgi:hypothetical protein